MDRSPRGFLVHGVVGGLIAGAVVALWFLVVDAAAGEALRTPAALGALLFPEVDAAGARVALYTLVHAGVFVALGVVTAAFLRLTGVRAGWLVGAFFGIVVLDAVHYGALLLADAPVLALLPWFHVVGANLAAGLALSAWLRWTAGDRRPVGLATLGEHPVVRDGLIAGLTGAAVVALWLFLVDVVTGEPFRTPAALGSAVLLGAESPDAVRITAGIVAAYTVVHAAVFAFVGLAFVAVARQVERLPGLAYVVVLGGIILEAVTLGVLVGFAGWVLRDVGVWAVAAGNVLAVVKMGGWVWWRHPRLRRRVAREGFATQA